MGIDPSARPTRTELLLATSASTLVLAVVTWPWLRVAATAIPDEAAAGNEWMGADARLIVWILSWDVHALWNHPLRLFDANILHPASGMLTGSEHLLATALLFAPTFLATGNPVLGANVTALATYVLAAVSIYALTRRLELPPLAAAVAALSFALGPLRVPADLHILQYPNYVLPLLLLAAIAFCDRGGPARAAGVAVAAALAVFSSYYMAAMAGFLVAVEVMLRMFTRRLRSALRLVAVLLPVLVAFAVFSIPYLGRVAPGEAADGAGWSGVGFQARLLDPADPGFGVGWPVMALALIGLLVPLLSRRAPTVRWWRWLALVVVGGTLALGPALHVGDARIPLPLAALRDTPLAGLAAVSRFWILAHLGVVGLAAEGVAWLATVIAPRSWVPHRLKPVLAAALVVACAVPRAFGIAALPRTELPTGDDVPHVYRWLAENATGPLLEIPGSTATGFRESESMYFSIHHWLPLVDGHTKFAPWWWGAIADELRHPPAPGTLQVLVDLTGVRWILLRSGFDHLPGVRDWVERLARSRGVERVEAVTGDRLYRVTLAPRRRWAEALATERATPGHTLLGTPLAPLEPEDAVGRIERIRAPRDATAGRRHAVSVRVHNDGPADWPALVHPDAPDDQLVVIVPSWHAEGGGERIAGDPLRLPRDLLAGDRVSTRLRIPVPEDPGAYTLELALRQIDGAGFEDSRPGRISVRVRPRGHRLRGARGAGGTSPAPTREVRRVHRVDD
jgi:hypothetical protein